MIANYDRLRRNLSIGGRPKSRTITTDYGRQSGEIGGRQRAAGDDDFKDI